MLHPGTLAPQQHADTVIHKSSQPPSLLTKKSVSNSNCLSSRHPQAYIKLESRQSQSKEQRKPMILAAIKMVSLAKVLSSCIDASRQGCEIIRDYHGAANGNVQGSLKEANEIKSVVTQADIDAQNQIIGTLRQIWGEDLKIVGEEDGSADNTAKTPAPSSDDLPSYIDASIFGDDDSVPLEELCVFVDPLDGTREFVEGRLHNVACLIGIMRNQRSIAGVVGLPFPDGTSDSEVVTYYAMTDVKNQVGRYPPLQEDEQASGQYDNTILTGDSSDPILLNATKFTKQFAEAADLGAEHKFVGGTAAKLIKVATNTESIAVLHFKTEQWDTCAPEALLKSNGGMITDLFGAPLSYSPTRPFGNVFGVVASSGAAMTKVHQQLCAKMRTDHASMQRIYGDYMGEYTISDANDQESQAMDVAYDLDGIPLKKEDLQQNILDVVAGRTASSSVHDDTAAAKPTLRGYSVPESGAWRGLMSTGCRLMLDWDGDTVAESAADGTASALPKSVFYKRIVMSNLDHSRKKLVISPHKVTRDVRSYQIESGFLTSDACQKGLIGEVGLNINKVYASTLRPIEGPTPKEQIESRFSLLLEDFNQDDGWKQQWLLDETAAKAALDTLASMHAYFWAGSDFWQKDGGRQGEELEKVIWPNGSYTQPQLQGLSQLTRIDAGWRKRLPDFEEACKSILELNDVDLATIGSRLEGIAAITGSQAHPFSDNNPASKDLQQYRTFIHGDPKQANLFFRSQDGAASPEVGLIDFQWSGFGLAASDVAHFISAAVHPSHLSFDGSKETMFLDYYYEQLTSKLVKYGVAKTAEEVQTSVFPRSVLQHQYEIAVLDMCRLVFAYAWQRWKPETEPTAASLNRNSYNKSLDSALWLITRCSQLLSKHEQTLK